MKKLNQFIFLSLLMVATLAQIGCNSDDDVSPTPTPTPQTSSASMSAEIDGRAWTADVKSASYGDGFVNITGVTNVGEAITITLQGDAAGTYTMDENSINASAYTGNESSNGSFTSYATSSSGGTVTVTDFDLTEKVISGTFSFVLDRTIDNMSREITEGEFKDISVTIN